MYVWKYGVKWRPLCDQLGRPRLKLPPVKIEAEILRRYSRYENVKGILPWEEHFMNFVTYIWGRENCQYKFTWNPYAREMLRNACKHKFLGISGHASSGKSQFGAIWAIANFLIDPETTRVLVTSTSLTESRMRIWGVIEKYWAEAEIYLVPQTGPLPGKLVSSSGKITGYMNGRSNDLVGITLIAGGKGNDGDASTKIGFKSMGKLIMIADELPLLTPKLYDAATNLLSVDKFQMIGTGNLTSIFDPFGMFVEPEKGWDSVTEDDYGWRTRVGGYCLRFDGEKSPNVLAGQKLYPGLLTEEGLREIREKFGPRSPGYYRMVKSFPCPTGQVDAIYSEPELTKNMASKKGTPWLDRPTPIAFLDPAFSKGGDRAAAAFGLVGWAPGATPGQRIKVLEKTDTLDLMMLVNVRAAKDRNEQLAELFIAECEKRNVAVPDRGADVTGGGDPFGTILAMKMGPGMQAVSFAGAASELPVSATDRRKGKDRFWNRVAELWYIGKEFLVSGQIRGLDPTTMMEMCARTYKEVGARVKVETKDEMKKRTSGRSPDYADAFFGLLEIARRRHGFLAAARSATIRTAASPPRSKYDAVFDAAFGTGAKPTWRDSEALPTLAAEQSGWGEKS